MSSTTVYPRSKLESEAEAVIPLRVRQRAKGLDIYEFITFSYSLIFMRGVMYPKQWDYQHTKLR
ncbi:MAG: hypothetical protein ACP8RL_01335, partial [cyanobacterium endosymbiont of Rhopalodia inflata]